MPLHMIKLVVGCDTIEDLLDWHAGQGRPWIMHTRQTPKRASELLEGGSLYRVFKGMILCRQPILAVDTVGEGVTARCEVTVDPKIVRVALVVHAMHTPRPELTNAIRMISEPPCQSRSARTGPSSSGRSQPSVRRTIGSGPAAGCRLPAFRRPGPAWRWNRPR